MLVTVLRSGTYSCPYTWNINYLLLSLRGFVGFSFTSSPTWVHREVQDLLKAAPSNIGLGQESERIALHNIVQLYQYYFNWSSKVFPTLKWSETIRSLKISPSPKITSSIPSLVCQTSSGTVSLELHDLSSFQARKCSVCALTLSLRRYF